MTTTRRKCLKYYLDSKIYGSKEIQESIEETKKEFLNKNVYVDITLNDFGMYVITFYFENKNNYFNKIKLKFKKKEKLLLEDSKINNDIIKKEKNKKVKKNKTKARLDKYYGKNYGQYKNTGIYKPY